MRNRLNVLWHGKRTTARFPPELWCLALTATEQQDVTLADDVKAWLRKLSGGACDHFTASELVREYLTCTVAEKLSPIAFNRDPEKRESENAKRF